MVCSVTFAMCCPSLGSGSRASRKFLFCVVMVKPKFVHDQTANQKLNQNSNHNSNHNSLVLEYPEGDVVCTTALTCPFGVFTPLTCVPIPQSNAAKTTMIYARSASPSMGKRPSTRGSSSLCSFIAQVIHFARSAGTW